MIVGWVCVLVIFCASLQALIEDEPSGLVGLVCAVILAGLALFSDRAPE